MVGAAHREYLEAGAELIETLSLGANRQRLAAWGLEGRVAQLNRRAAQLARDAREVSGRDALVGGSIGPLGPPTRGLPDIPEAAARATFREQIEGLLEGGADVIVLETFSDLGQLVLAVDEVRRASDVPVIASLTFGEELVLADGSSPKSAADALAGAGADAIGVNCGAGPAACLDALEAMGRPAEGEPERSIMPNAGLSQRLEGRFLYAASPDYFGTVTRGCWPPAPASSVAAAARRRRTRRRCGWLSTPSARTRRARRSPRHWPDPPPAPRRRSPAVHRGHPSRKRQAASRPPGRPSTDPPGRAARRRPLRDVASRSTLRGASGSSARSRRPNSCATRAWTSSTSPTRRWPGSG